MNPLLLFGEETERLYFRELKDSDYKDWLKFCSDAESIQYLSTLQNGSPEEICDYWFENVYRRYKNNLGGMNVLIEKTTGKMVGQCGLLVQEVDGKEELEIGYSLLKEHRGKGYALEAAKKCKEYAYEHQLSESLVSLIHEENKSSMKVAINNGMLFDKEINRNEKKYYVFRIEMTNIHQIY